MIWNLYFRTLIADIPWKSEEQKLMDKALFLDLTRKIGSYFNELEEMTKEAKIPEWMNSFIQKLYNDRSPVITLNYDTLFEKLYKNTCKIEGFYKLYH